MKQKISIRAIIKQDGKVLLLRRATGRPSILGKFELPGGKLDFREQPEDSLRRHVKVHLDAELDAVQLFDVMSFIDPDEPSLQYVFIVYQATVLQNKSSYSLSNDYDKYLWKKVSDIQHNSLTSSGLLLLGLTQNQDITESKSNSDSNIVDKTTTNNHFIINTDGGSRGNPGPSAAGYIITNDAEQLLAEGGAYLGITTNNQAEYQAVYLAMQKAAELGGRVIELRIDSLLVVNQMNGIYKIKNRDLWPIHERIKELAQEFEKVTFTHVRREFNAQADAMVNRLLDEQEKNAS